jgi:CheY-like chemotaxis protein
MADFGHRLRVLVADDNRDAADTLAVLLGAWGYAVAVAYDGEAALRAARDHRPDCALLDLNMPRLDGYAAARLIRGELAETRLIAVSAYSDEAHVRRVYEAGFDEYITKPADPVEIGRMLAMLDDIKKLAHQNAQLLREVKGEVREMRQEVREEMQGVKEELQEMQELKEGLEQVKEEVKGLREEMRRGEEVRD